PTPTVVSISPTSGSNTGGTRVTIRGTGFRTGATVLIGASACNSVSNSATSLTCTTPLGTASATAVEVSVTNSDLQKGSKASAYTYTSP
ncbi:MAG: IPT/TIG domain-containing protein, partial [Deltaproteobacteria bacterium]|nr:IPT/TIG domain-containing protein [Deltaproteobacteria bacterium]